LLFPEKLSDNMSETVPAGDIDWDLVDQVEREECKKSFFAFVETFWEVIIAEEPVYNWHIPYLCEELQTLSVPIVAREKKLYDMIINIPPGTTKTTITTIMFPAWLWTQDPTLRIITNSYAMDLSIEHATKSRDIIVSDKYQRLFPDLVIRADKSAKRSYENTANGARYTTSTGGTITGKHAHIIINDDPLNPSQAASDADRETANSHTKTLSSRKVNKENTPTVTIMQRLHEDDVTGYLLKKKSNSIYHICLPAEASASVKPAKVKEKYLNGYLDPVRLGREVLDEAMVDLGSRGYAGQFDQSPSAPGGNIVKQDWFKYVTRETFDKMRYREPIVFFGDTAYTNNAMDNDPSGFIAACKIRNDLYITKATKVWLIFPDLIKFLPEWVLANGYTNESSIRIEPKANGVSVIDQLSSSTTLNITKTPSPKDDKKTRLNTASPKIECGRVFIVIDAWNEEFTDEICGFPAKSHDEYVDLIAYAVDHFLNDSGLAPDDLSGMF